MEAPWLLANVDYGIQILVSMALTTIAWVSVALLTQPNDDVTFLELLFQPVPYSTNTPHGMPRAFEPYHNSDDYLVVNVPANFMFQARISRPARLCAIYRKVLEKC
jgi:hypothetical protein